MFVSRPIDAERACYILCNQGRKPYMICPHLPKNITIRPTVYNNTVIYYGKEIGRHTLIQKTVVYLLNNFHVMASNETAQIVPHYT